jgi:hypothetical protein
LWAGLLDVSPALALDEATTGTQQQAPPEPFYIDFTVVFTDPAIIEITDLAGVGVGQGTHLGLAKCHQSKCRHRVNLALTSASDPSVSYVIEYRFSEPLVIDPDEGRAVLAGTGTLGGNGMKERFSFTATFEDKRDGSLAVTYVSSRPNASFNLVSPGQMSFGSR